MEMRIGCGILEFIWITCGYSVQRNEVVFLASLWVSASRALRGVSLSLIISQHNWRAPIFYLFPPFFYYFISFTPSCVL